MYFRDSTDKLTRLWFMTVRDGGQDIPGQEYIGWLGGWRRDMWG